MFLMLIKFKVIRGILGGMSSAVDFMELDYYY